MAKTNAQNQAALRARRLAQGLTEVRGVYLPPHFHIELKAIAKRWRGPLAKQFVVKVKL